jgi:putative transposase
MARTGELLPENRSTRKVIFPGSRRGRRTRHEERKRFSEEQIIGILNEAAAGATAVEVCRRHGISETTFYRWKAQFGGMAVSDARRLRQIEAEKTRLKRLVADAHPDNAALKDLLTKNW